MIPARQKHRGRRPSAGAPDARLVDEVIRETRQLFHQLKAVAAEIHGLGEMSAGMRGVLESLHERGPQTVPQIARSRPVSRQFIQSLVNTLLERQLVVLTDNPAHKRSRLVALTEEGRSAIVEMKQREQALITQLPLRCSEADLGRAAEVLRDLAQAFAAVHRTAAKGGQRGGATR